MPMTDAQKRAKRADEAKNIFFTTIGLRRTTDADLVAYFENITESKSGEIKRLLRKAIAAEKAEQEQ